MEEKVLFVATVDRGHILKFHIPYLKLFKQKGFEVHVACSGDADIPYCDKKYNLTFNRKPYKVENFNAYRKLKKIIKNNSYSLIHCHTPVGGTIGRLAAKSARKKGTKVLYTAHGFHFFKGASLKNWLIYFSVEKWLSRYTDYLITINKEDYKNAIKYNFKSNKIKMVNGVGIDLDKFSPVPYEEKRKLRSKYGYNENDFILIYTAELNYNKRQDLMINTVYQLKDDIPNIKLLLVGSGDLDVKYKVQTRKLKLQNSVDFLGFRKDVPDLLRLSDVSVSSSRREGLPVHIMESMATGLPLVVSNCRGNRDLVKDGENGYIVRSNNVEEFSNAINKLYNSEETRTRFKKKGLELVKLYSIENVMKDMERIYSSCINTN